jgi:hypothetical protein
VLHSSCTVFDVKSDAFSRDVTHLAACNST